MVLIDQTRRQTGPGSCEVCQKNPATRRSKFTAQYLESTASAIFDEESLVTTDMEKRVCEECLKSLQNAKNITNLTFERI
jgi:hypothetical protein